MQNIYIPSLPMRSKQNYAKRERKSLKRARRYEHIKTYIPPFLSPVVTPLSSQCNPLTSLIVSYFVTETLPMQCSKKQREQKETAQEFLSISSKHDKKRENMLPCKYNFTAPGSFTFNFNLHPCVNGKKNNKPSLREKKRVSSKL